MKRLICVGTKIISKLTELCDVISSVLDELIRIRDCGSLINQIDGVVPESKEFGCNAVDGDATDGNVVEDDGA